MRENIVSLSGGKDSTAMLHLMLEHGPRVDEVVFFDTGWEFPEMYEHLAQVEEKTGLRITRLLPKEPFTHALVAHEKTRGKRKGERGYGFPTMQSRWCTAMKQTAIAQHLKGRDVRQFVGIAADEAHRCKQGISYPLVDAGMTEGRALEYCYALGYTWGGLYDHFKRVSCWCCPLQSIGDLRELRRFYPTLYDELLTLDMAVQRSDAPQKRFRADYDLPSLELRFRNEDRQMKLELGGD